MANNQSPLAQLKADIDQNITNAELGLGNKFFPVDAFRPCVQRIFNSVAYDLDCHRDKAVMAGLVTVCGTVGKRATLVSGKYRNHPSMFGVLVDRPGAVKSKVNNYFLKPLEKLNKAARARYNRQRIKVLEENLLNNTDKPIPAPSLYMTKDVTIERLKELLVNSKVGILEYHDELAGMFANFGKYSRNGGGAEIEPRMTFYNGTTVDIADRSKDKDAELAEDEDEIAYSLYGSIQYKTFVKYFKPIVEADNGGYDRFFIVECPAHKLRHRNINDGWTLDPAEWETIIKDLDQIPEGSEYTLSSDAEKFFKIFDDELIDKRNEDLEGNDFIIQTLARAGQNCLRLALIIHLLNDWHEKDVTGFEMNMAVRMMRIFLENASTCYNKIYENDKQKEHKDKQNLTLSNQVRQYYLFMKTIGKTADDVNQSALAKLYGCSQAYINKVKQSLIKEGLIDGSVSAGKEEGSPVEEPVTPVSVDDNETSDNTEEVVTSPSEGTPSPEVNKANDITDGGVPSVDIASHLTQVSELKSHNPPKIRGDNDDITPSNEISDISPTT